MGNIIGFNSKRLSIKGNEKEVEVVEIFKENFSTNDLNNIVYGSKPTGEPNGYLTDKQQKIVMSVIQWLGSPVGQGFVNKIKE